MQRSLASLKTFTTPSYTSSVSSIALLDATSKIQGPIQQPLWVCQPDALFQQEKYFVCRRDKCRSLETFLRLDHDKYPQVQL